MTTLSEEQLSVVMDLGRAAEAAMLAFPGRTIEELASAAHSTWRIMQTISGNATDGASDDAVAPVGKAKKAKSPAKKVGNASTSAEKATAIRALLDKVREPLSAADIAKNLKIRGRGIGPILGKLAKENRIVRSGKEHSYRWGSAEAS